MKVLVTGGAGFIGSHIVDKLVENGDEVIIIDNLSTGNMENINKKAVFYEADIRDKEIDKIFEVEKPEVVIHHAAQIDIQKSIKDPMFDGDVNIIGTINLLENCKKYKVRKIIYASSAAVYGTPKYLPVDEKHRVSPISYYGISKHTPEHYIKVYAELYGIKYTILRYANVYGIRQDPKGEGGVVSIFLDLLLNGKNPTIFGDGEQTRDYIYVEDIASANVKALKLADNEICNISTNKKTTVTELFNMMRDILKSECNAIYGDERKGDIKHSTLNNEKAMKLLDWEPGYSIGEGLTKTIEYYRLKREKNA
ncbi:SDR family oxidoreductase [Crassaminicella indica]|uniref:SDR family oxidoreductase n=1 Tax=Crassaminicella indica TaxID=2855394 RepID=A0ABX8RCA1_9CLOT|nr:SDR family oxidoreductase [Crassaminicella indica]QXM06675.1 SDR family oxidoreductase [Crassaminicella indica]